MTPFRDRVILYRDLQEQWRWTVRAWGNWRVIASSSESFTTRRACVGNLQRLLGGYGSTVGLTLVTDFGGGEGWYEIEARRVV